MAIMIVIVRGGTMYCKICGEYREGFRIFGIHMCKECFYEFAFSDVEEDKYDFYKNLIRILLGYYIGERQSLRPYPTL